MPYIKNPSDIGQSQREAAKFDSASPMFQNGKGALD